ncbi:hypothetical protein [Sphingobacterium yanglingense]|uniref:Uncharacterized protein n=1 Tax=Sphingobacterium yanglingense TaxID=1437280 RepID=A0A4R6W8C9_9SPHI|nr:hypothetical protein [Sphingobacterium yanglingense]TDQ73801.1 hypothetical protein CLV99_4238 [Sphingobacterium yanglingense]
METKERAENIQSLATKMYYSGFSEITVDQLQKQFDEAVKNKKDSFQVVLDKKSNGDSVRAVLNFDFSQNSGKYYFNNFDLLLKKYGKEETLQQKFYVGYGSNYTLKEGYNLLDGRSVYKHLITTDKIDREKKNEFKGWVKLDFNDANESGNFKIQRINNFDIAKNIEEYALKGIENDKYKQNLINSLKKGNQASVTIETSAGERKIVIEAQPSYNSIKLYDENLKPILLSMKRKIDKTVQGKDNNNSQSQAGENQSPKVEENNVVNSKDQNHGNSPDQNQTTDTLKKVEQNQAEDNLLPKLEQENNVVNNKDQNQSTDTSKKVEQNQAEENKNNEVIKKSQDNKQTGQKKSTGDKRQTNKRSVRV